MLPEPTEETRDLMYRVQGSAIKDRAGHTLYLRGMNVANRMKDVDGYLIDFDQSERDTLKASGITVIRLLTFWTAIMPVDGEVDADYLERFRAFLDSFTDDGFWVIVDMHQDLWGRPFRNHGAPPWACPEELQEGYVTVSPWWANYTSEQVSGCFDHFWDAPELHEKFNEAWRIMASSVCNNDKVLGFDVLNEPYTGQTHMTADFDNEYLMPFYEKAMQAIDEVCDDRIFFLEPSSLGVLGLADPIQFPESYDDRIVYSGHFYPRYVHEVDGGGYDGDRDALIQLFRKQFGPHMDDGRAIWVGEYGGHTTSPNYDGYLEDLHGYWEEHGIHHAYWDVYASAEGFAFHDENKVRKKVFDGVYPMPLPKRLPGTGVVEPDYTARQADVAFECVAGRGGEVIMPNESCRCYAADDILDNITQENYLFTFECLTDGAVNLDCNCEE